MKILITIHSWCNACQSSAVFSTIRGYLKCAEVHHHRIMYFCSMLLSNFGLTVDSLFWLVSKIGLLKFALGFVNDKRILIKVIKYTGHHNACAIRLLLGYHEICTITNNQFLKCLWVHGKTLSALPNLGKNLKVLPFLLLIYFAQVFHLRRSQN